MARFLDYDPLTGMTQLFHYNPDSDQVVIEYQQDVTPILEQNKQAYLDTDKHKRQAKEEWAHYATIPDVVQMEWAIKHGVHFWDKNHTKAWGRLLNSPDYAYLRRTTYKHEFR